MRGIVEWVASLLLALAFAALPRAAAADDGVSGEARRAIEEANAALAADPPRRDPARAALARAAAAEGVENAAAASEAHYRLGVLDEEDEAFAGAEAHYRASIARAPVNWGGRWSRNASVRMQWLAVRSEGGFAPLTRLHRWKREAALASDPAAVAAFAGDVEAFPPGIVRAEARTFVAAAWMGLGRPAESARVFRLVLADRTADGATALVASRGLVDALVADGRVDEAAKEVQIHASQIDAEQARRVEQLARRRSLSRGGILLGLAALAVLGALVLARALRARRAAPPRALRSSALGA